MSDDQPFAPPSQATDLGDVQRAGKTAGKGARHIDPANVEQLYRLAVRLQAGDQRALLRPTAAEIQGLAWLAALATPILVLAIDLVEQSDAGNACPGCVDALTALIETTRQQLATQEQRP